MIAKDALCAGEEPASINGVGWPLQTQPFCDGSHTGTDHSPVEVEFTEKKRVAWCGCKHTNKQPFCDGTHSNLEE